MFGRTNRIILAASRLLLKWNLRPNHISIMSMVFSLGSALALWKFEANILFLLLAICCIGLRGLCNLLDGIMAVEGGFKTSSGAFFNEFPDRISDTLMLIGCGFGCGAGLLGQSLGWACALVAMFTAYVRVFGSASGLPQDYCGPMAKPQRMLAIVLGCLGSLIETWQWGTSNSLVAALVIVLIGGIATCIRRSSRLIARLEKGQSPNSLQGL